ncbi:MAG: TIGR02466 family protein, partial [Planctomycetota bacterium]
SGVYYVQSPEGAGAVNFTDPRTQNLILTPRLSPDNRSKNTWTSVQYEPVAGRLILFPSWLYHAVEPNLSELAGEAGDRICISFNMIQRRKKNSAGDDSRNAASQMM